MSENLIQYVIDAGKGDTAAMGMLYAKTLKTSFFLASKLSGSETQAVEIIKKAYARAFCSIEKLKKPEAFEIWLKQIIASIYKDGARFIFADADANAQELSADFLPESVLASEELVAKVSQAVSQLSPERRTAVILFYNNGMPVNVLSRFLGVSDSTANAILGKAKADILANAGVEAPEIPEVASLPVLTRVFKELTDKTVVDGALVREIFTFAIEAYAVAKPKAEETTVEAAEEAVEEKTEETVAETTETAAEESAEETAAEEEQTETEESEEVPAEETVNETEEEEVSEDVVEEATEEVTEEAEPEKAIEDVIDEEKAEMEESILSFRNKISSMLGVESEEKTEDAEAEADAAEVEVEVEETSASDEISETAEEETPVAADEEVTEETETEEWHVEIKDDTVDDDAFERIRRSVPGLDEIKQSVEEEYAVEETTEEETVPVPVPEAVPGTETEEKPKLTKNPSIKFKKKPEKKTAKVNIKVIIAAIAVLAVVIVAVVLLVGGGKKDDNTTTTTPVADTLKVPVEFNVIPALDEYKNIEFLNEKFSSFRDPDTRKYGLIDYQGNVVLSPEYDGFRRCSNGRYYGEGSLADSGYHILAVKGDAEYEVVMMGETAIVSNIAHADHATSNNTSMSGGDYDERDRYYEGYAAVRKNGKWGYVAQNSGKLVVPYEFEAVNDVPADDPSAAYDYCRGSSNGYIAVKKGGKMGVIKIEKDAYKIVVDFTYDMINQGNGGTFLAYNGKNWGSLEIGTLSEITTDAPASETTTLPPVVTTPAEVSIGTFVVNDDESNIRTSPDTDKDDNIITALNKGYKITAYEKKEGSNGSEWVRFEYEGKEAWISSKKLDKAE